VPATGRVYRQMYAGRLEAKDGKIQLLRESMDTVAAAKAFAPVEPGNAVKPLPSNGSSNAACKLLISAESRDFTSAPATTAPNPTSNSEILMTVTLSKAAAERRQLVLALQSREPLPGGRTLGIDRPSEALRAHRFIGSGY